MAKRGRKRTQTLTAGQRAFACLPGTQAEIARALKVSQQVVSEYARGLTRPGPLVRERAAKLYGIPALSWLTKTEAKDLEATRAA